MLREHDRSLRSLVLALDLAFCAFVYAAAVSLGDAKVAEGSWRVFVLGCVATVALPLALRTVSLGSSRFESSGDLILHLMFAVGIAGIVLGATAFSLRAEIGRSVLLGSLVAQTAGLGLTRLVGFSALRWLRRQGRNYRNVVVIGTGPRAVEFTETLALHPEWGLRLLGYVDERDTPIDERLPAEHISKLADFPQLLREHVIDEVIVVCPRSMLGALGPAVAACSEAGIPLTVMSDLFGDYLPPPTVRRVGPREGLSFAPVHHNASMLATKRAIDILGAVAGLLVAAPVLALAAVAIKLSSKGPLFFRQVRCGLYGRPFVMYKLRTMVCDAEDRREALLHLNEMDGPVFKIRQDPRLTRVGRLLRQFSIDELPQFWNVLRGDMSLVGPRPPIPAEVAQYKTWERRRLSMRPGLTCLWQVSGRNALSFEEWVRLDLEYIDTWSLAKDLKLLLMTAPVVLKGTGE